METKNIEIKGKGIKVHVLSIIFIVLGVLVMTGSFFAIQMNYSRYDNMRKFYDENSLEREAAHDFQTASDYLTNQARKYASTGDAIFLENYFNEKDNICTRETSLTRIQEKHGEDMQYNLLKDAMQQSEDLVEYELHAMKLVALSYGMKTAEMPDQLAAYELSADELAMDAVAQQNQATDILHSVEYENYKDRISWDIENAAVLIEEELEVSFRNNQVELIWALNIASALVFLMFALMFLIFIFNTLLVARPASKFVEALDQKKKLPEIGGYEFRKFARRYNDQYRTNIKNQSLLAEQGEIDELTGTLKVSTLDIIKHSLSQSDDSLGVMMVDIDNFRSIKEASGYEIADLLVKKVAKQFTKTFLKSDYIVRTSQDEFELFLPKMKESDAQMLMERIEQINQTLQAPTDGIPKASISVGIAFSEKGYDQETERNADMALNYVKEHGRAACRIYQPS